MASTYKTQTERTKTSITNHIKHWLNQNSISLLEFSNKTSIGYGTLYKIVHDNANFTIETLVKMTTVLNLSISQLINEADLNNPQYIKSIPIIKWIDILPFIACPTKDNDTTDFVTVTSNTHELNQMFAIRSNEQTMNYFPVDTIFVLNRINHDIKIFDNRYVIFTLDDMIVQFGKLIISGNDLFLQNYNPNIPPCRLTENIKVIAYLHEARTCFNSLPTLNW